MYKQFPSLHENNLLRDFIYLLAFQNLQRKWAVTTFINYTETLNDDIKDYLENYNYTNLVEKVYEKILQNVYKLKIITN